MPHLKAKKNTQESDSKLIADAMPLFFLQLGGRKKKTGQSHEVDWREASGKAEKIVYFRLPVVLSILFTHTYATCGMDATALWLSQCFSILF